MVFSISDKLVIGSFAPNGKVKLFGLRISYMFHVNCQQGWAFRVNVLVYMPRQLYPGILITSPRARNDLVEHILVSIAESIHLSAPRLERSPFWDDEEGQIQRRIQVNWHGTFNHRNCHRTDIRKHLLHMHRMERRMLMSRIVSPLWKKSDCENYSS